MENHAAHGAGTSMTEETLLFQVDSRGVATATFNRPRVRNAYNGRMLEALLQALARCEGDEGVRVVVLRGNGPVFQSGADLDWLDGRIPMPRDAFIEDVAALTHELERVVQREMDAMRND